MPQAHKVHLEREEGESGMPQAHSTSREREGERNAAGTLADGWIDKQRERESGMPQAHLWMDG